jgi:short-subunit dehydrogenase
MKQDNIGPQRPLEPQRKAIIVGASSGIGAALVEELARKGFTVAALARSEEQLEELANRANRHAGEERVLPCVHDVTSFDDVPQLFRDLVQKLGGLDLIVYVAGIQPPVAPNEYNFDKDAAMVGVNLLGAMAWLNQAAGRFHEAGYGHIAAISSISGDRGRSAFPAYHTSKGALSIYMESLRNRLSRRGVTVTTLKPGFVDTELLANAGKAFWVISPQEAARQIVDALDAGKQLAYVPGRWRWVSLIISNIPSVIFRRLNF